MYHQMIYYFISALKNTVFLLPLHYQDVMNWLFQFKTENIWIFLHIFLLMTHRTTNVCLYFIFLELRQDGK